MGRIRSSAIAPTSRTPPAKVRTPLSQKDDVAVCRPPGFSRPRPAISSTVVHFSALENHRTAGSAQSAEEGARFPCSPTDQQGIAMGGENQHLRRFGDLGESWRCRADGQNRRLRLSISPTRTRVPAGFAARRRGASGSVMRIASRTPDIVLNSLRFRLSAATDSSQHGVAHSAGAVNIEAQCDHAIDHALDLGFFRARFHDD